jgi:hypothetical protein
MRATKAAALLLAATLTIPTAATASADSDHNNLPVSTYPVDSKWSPPTWGQYPVDSKWSPPTWGHYPAPASWPGHDAHHDL